MQERYKRLAQIITTNSQISNISQPTLRGYPQQNLQAFLLAFINKQKVKIQQETINKFILYMAQQRMIKINADVFDKLQNIKIIACSQNKYYSFDSNLKAYCLYGKAASVLRRKGKQPESQRISLASQVQNTIFQLKGLGKYYTPKNQSNDIDDILLNYFMPDATADPIIQSNQVFSPFVPQTFAIVMITPQIHTKPQNLFNMMKSTLLHTFIQQINVISKVIVKQSFYKNSVLKGIYFVQEGQVQSSGGRIVARGWITLGKCKLSGTAWKFKAIPFLKSIARNQLIWKQFLNDLKLNEQYPFKLSNILGIDLQNEYQYIQKKGKRSTLHLPRIFKGSLNMSKLQQIEKVKHYNDRLDEICQFKQKLLKRNIKSNFKSDFQNFISKNKQQKRHEYLAKNMSRHSFSQSNSSQNILIMSVLKKLQQVTTTNSPKEVQQQKNKNTKIKIGPAMLFQKSRIMKKKRYE